MKILAAISITLCYNKQVNKRKPMNSKQQTIQKIQELEQQLEVLKKDLKQKFPTITEAKVGDVLEDGSIVVEKTNSMALLAAPESTGVRCEWSIAIDKVIGHFDFERVHNAMVALDWKWANFPNGEFRVPTIDELKMQSYYHLCNAMREETTISSGGLKARYDCKSKNLTLEFVLSEWYEKVPSYATINNIASSIGKDIVTSVISSVS